MSLERTLTTEHKWRLDSLRTYEFWEVEKVRLNTERTESSSILGRRDMFKREGVVMRKEREWMIFVPRLSV